LDWLSQGLPSIDLSHLDLSGRQQSPEQHRHGIEARQNGLGFDPSSELLVE